MLLLLLATFASSVAAADGERAPSHLLQVTLTLALAVVVYVSVTAALRANQAKKPTAKALDDKKACVLQVDEELERVADANAQLFPVGARVKLAGGRGEGEVAAYDHKADAYDVKLEKGEKTVRVKSTELVQPTVSDFYIYPIKSCGGIRLESAQITVKGLLHDREWMFADEKGKFITQRRYHKLALVHPKLVPDVENPTAIVLTAKGMPDLKVPIIHESAGKEMQVNVWKADILAIDQGDAAAQWINTFLADQLGDRKIRLVHFKESFVRPTHERYAPGHQTGFADAFPILLTADSSLDDLNKHLNEPVPMNRFRPNIVLTGVSAWADDYWNCLTIGPLKFRNVRPCGRCNLPCVDQATGTTHPGREPSKTLVRVRNGVALGFEYASKADNYFGSNLVVEKTGRLNVGDPVKILTMKEKVYA